MTDRCWACRKRRKTTTHDGLAWCRECKGISEEVGQPVCRCEFYTGTQDNGRCKQCNLPVSSSADIK